MFVINGLFQHVQGGVMITREIMIFSIVGTLTVLIDFLVYRGLVLTQLFDIDWSEGMGFFVGTIFAYVANRFWTFGQKAHAPGMLGRFLVLYLTTCFVNVLVNTTALFLLGRFTFAIHGAFLLATGASACLNFLGMKLFVFSEPIATKELA